MKNGNIKFITSKNKIEYNAIKKFNNNIVKIPSYVIDEVIHQQMTLEIHHKNEIIKTYNYENILNFIKLVEQKPYKGTFRDKNIVYKLNHIEV